MTELKTYLYERIESGAISDDGRHFALVISGDDVVPTQIAFPVEALEGLADIVMQLDEMRTTELS